MCQLLESRAMFSKLVGGQIEAHPLRAKEFTAEEISREDRGQLCKAFLVAKPCTPLIVWSSDVCPCPKHDFHSDQWER